MTFADPVYLALLVVPLAYVWLRWPRRRRLPTEHVGFPALVHVAGRGPGGRERWVRLPVGLRAAGLCLAVLALARPQATLREREEPLRGRNLVLTLDVSSSMRTEDFRPRNRLHVAKAVLADFVRARRGDLMGLVVFAGKPFVQVPLTTDADALVEILSSVESGILPDGTGIGTALAASLDRLSDLPPRSSAVVLVTDGVNNTGLVDPLTAAEAARALGIRVYTIGVSAPPAGFIHAWKPARLRDRQAMPALDEAVLRRIAERTQGRFYRATDARGLARVLADVDRLEEIEVRRQRVPDRRELYPLLLLPALALCAGDLALRATLLRALP